MTSMGQHSEHSAAGAPLRRAHFTAWAVFLGMAGTSMVFQVFHSIHVGHMPWPLAYLYGIVPLAVSVGVLEVAAKWQSKGAKAGAWLVTAGAMFLSAFATGAVTASAAPPHAELLFGAVLDAAALLTVRFILDGPRAAHAVAAVAKREAELLGQAAAERSAREQAQANAERMIRELGTERAAELEAERQAHDAAVTTLRADLAAEQEARETAQADAAALALVTAELDETRTALENAATARHAAEQARAEAERLAELAQAKAASLSRKVAANSGAKGNRTRAARDATSVPSDMDAQAAALTLWSANPAITGRELGEACGMGERWGQLRKKEFATRIANAS